MAIFVPFFLSALVGALAFKILLYFLKRKGSFLGLFLIWLFVSLLAMCTPYPFLCVLLFGFLFVRATDVRKIWPYGILAMLLYWGLHQWIDRAMAGLFWSFLNEFNHRWHHVEALAIATRRGGLN
jgi:hypothetical protein